MQNEVHESDPYPEFPEWLASADVVREIASLGMIDEEETTLSADDAKSDQPADSNSSWDQLTPKLLSREVLSSSEKGSDFGRHLQSIAWQQGVIDAPRTAFVTDGASVNWTVHKQHFSHMTGILDLMHALSYAWKAAKALVGSASYQRYASWIWQGNVRGVIEELESLQTSQEERFTEDSHDETVARAITYFENHQHLMNYPDYRKQGLPLTSSHIESTIKLINIRMKGSEKFFGHATGETLLQLRADSLCKSRPLDTFWQRWLQNQNGANTYRKQATLPTNRGMHPSIPLKQL